MPFVHGLYCDGIFFRICPSSSTVFLSPESSIIESCTFTVFFCQAYFVGTPGPCAPLLWSINTVPECLFSSIGYSVETFVDMSMVVCEVEQPPGIFCSSCVSCRSWRKSCDRD